MRETNHNTKIQLYCCGHLGDLGDLGDLDDPAIVGCVQPRSRSGLALFSQACRVPAVKPGLGKALCMDGRLKAKLGVNRDPQRVMLACLVCSTSSAQRLGPLCVSRSCCQNGFRQSVLIGRTKVWMWPSRSGVTRRRQRGWPTFPKLTCVCSVRVCVLCVRTTERQTRAQPHPNQPTNQPANQPDST